MAREDVLKRPARLQVDPETIVDDDKPPQTGTTFNIWYMQWSGGADSSRNYVKSKFRVSIKKDSGYTKAVNSSSICLFFARGCCYLGPKCSYWHRLPDEKDHFIPTQDCFGRDKTAEYRDDMSGTGSFNRVNRSLYIGGLHMKDNMDSLLTKQFEEFGSIEKIRVLSAKSCAFITFKLESEAQFAKEAMQNQTISGNDVIYIRWANEDPNPEAQKQEKRRIEEIAISTVKGLLEEHESKKKKKIATTRDEKSVSNLSERPAIELGNESLSEKNNSQNTNANDTDDNSYFHSSSLTTLKRLKIPQRPKEKPAILVGYSSSDED